MRPAPESLTPRTREAMLDMLDLIAESEAPHPATHHALLVAVVRAGDAAREHSGPVVDRVR